MTTTEPLFCTTCPPRFRKLRGKEERRVGRCWEHKSALVGGTPATAARGAGHTPLPVPALLALVEVPTPAYGDGFAAREAEDRAYEAEHGPAQAAATRALAAARETLSAAWDACEGKSLHGPESRGRFAANDAFMAAEKAEKVAYARETAIEGAQDDYRALEQDVKDTTWAACSADAAYWIAQSTHKRMRSTASADAYAAAGWDAVTTAKLRHAADDALAEADDTWPATMDAARAVR